MPGVSFRYMGVDSCVILDGVLKEDGTLELESRPALPPGPVRVRLEAVSMDAKSRISSPDTLHDQGMIEPWVELPLPQKGAVVYPKPGKLPLPDPIDIPEDES